MGQHYFLLLELPGGTELKFCKNNCSPLKFWNKAARSIKSGRAKIISKRQDTGISEELRNHLQKIRGFKTFILVHTHLTTEELSNRKVFFEKIAKWITIPENEIVIDAAENFQLVTLDVK